MKFKKLFSNFFQNGIKSPTIKENTFIVWEPCSKSHSEVVPGYVKYLVDLGYHVSVLVEPERLKEGLFSKFSKKDLEKISFNKINSKESKKFFLNKDLSKIKGILVTTVGKICDSVDYNQCYLKFNSTVDKNKLFFVEHEIKHSVDAGTWNNKNITLRKVDYKNTNSVVVNPHFFGNVSITPKNNQITNFLTIGALKPYKKNIKTIIDSVLKLHKEGINNFKVTVVGKGKIKHLPKEIRKYFDIKGKLSFLNMYNEIEKADFILTSYDNDDPTHIRYITTGTSGNFQLIYGFLKPCVISSYFAPINEFNNKNSILYDDSKDYYLAMKKAIEIDNEEYVSMQNELKKTVENIYKTSKDNLEKLINE